MPNTFLTPDIIANEALMVLENNTVMAGLVHRDYSKEFNRVGDTITIRKPAKFIAKNFVGETSEQSATEGSTTVTLDHFRDVTVPVTSKELTLDIKDFSAQIVTPAMQAISQAVDSDIIGEGIRSAGRTVAGTADATDLKDLANIAKGFDLAAVPVANRRLVLHPTHKYRYLTTDNLTKVAYAGTGDALRNAELGQIYGLDTYMSQNAPDTLAEKSGTATAAKITCTAGAETVALSGVTAATGTIKKGDGFILDGYLYRFAEDKTAASGVVESIAIDQPIHKAVAEAEDIYLIHTTHSLAFHRNGLALVTRQLELPMGASKASIASADGFAVRVVFDYDSTHKKDTVSFDVLYGVKTLNSSMTTRLVG